MPLNAESTITKAAVETEIPKTEIPDITLMTFRDFLEKKYRRAM